MMTRNLWSAWNVAKSSTPKNFTIWRSRKPSRRKKPSRSTEILDAKTHNTIHHFEIPKEGIILVPSKLYLGVTEEYTETHAHVPFLEGKSSIGRLGIDIHATAGKGDVGFCNTWTLEISVRQPVRIYAGMPIGQLIYFVIDGDVEVLYNRKENAKYNRHTNKPVESMMWKNFKK